MPASRLRASCASPASTAQSSPREPQGSRAGAAGLAPPAGPARRLAGFLGRDRGAAFLQDLRLYLPFMAKYSDLPMDLADLQEARELLDRLA